MMEEGFVQGDPSAPLWAQLMYSAICQEVRREYPETIQLLSFIAVIILLSNGFSASLLVWHGRINASAIQHDLYNLQSVWVLLLVDNHVDKHGLQLASGGV